MMTGMDATYLLSLPQFFMFCNISRCVFNSNKVTMLSYQIDCVCIARANCHLANVLKRCQKSFDLCYEVDIRYLSSSTFVRCSVAVRVPV